MITGNRGPPFLVEALELLVGVIGVDRGVDRLEVPGDVGELAAGHVFQAVADEVHDARLHRGLGKTASIASGKPLRPSTQQIRMSCTPRCLSSVRTCIQNFAPSVSWNHMPSTSRSPSIVTPSAR